MLLFVANVLDPRCKLEFVTFCFSNMYESRKVEELKSNIKELLMKLYNSYIGGSDVRNSGGVCLVISMMVVVVVVVVVVV